MSPRVCWEGGLALLAQALTGAWVFGQPHLSMALSAPTPTPVPRTSLSAADMAQGDLVLLTRKTVGVLNKKTRICWMSPWAVFAAPSSGPHVNPFFPDASASQAIPPS